MIRASIFRLVPPAAALVFALAGCLTGNPTLKPQGLVTVTLAADKKAAVVNAKPYNEIVITLPTPREPGYRWEIAFHDVRILKQTTEILPPGESRTGPTVSFIARIPGRTRLRFMLVPDNHARVVDPIDKYDVTLEIE